MAEGRFAEEVELLVRLRGAGADVVTINSFPATKKGEDAHITRVFDIELRDLGPVEALEVAETVPGVTTAGARPTLGQVFGKRVIVIGTGCSAAQFVPEIAPLAGNLEVFQRTPPWLLPTIATLSPRSRPSCSGCCRSEWKSSRRA